MNVALPLLIVVSLVYWWNRPTLPSFTLVYADWCPHCQAILPKFKLFKFPGVATTWVEQKWANIKVPAFPTFLYTDASGNTEQYTGSRDPASWTAYLSAKQNATPQ